MIVSASRWPAENFSVFSHNKIVRAWGPNSSAGRIMELRSYGITATDGQTDVEVEIVF